ncbi:hypothetical protein GCM10009599_11340 [Luteococcus peritonei]
MEQGTDCNIITPPSKATSIGHCDVPRPHVRVPKIKPAFEVIPEKGFIGTPQVAPAALVAANEIKHGKKVRVLSSKCFLDQPRVGAGTHGKLVTLPFS